MVLLQNKTELEMNPQRLTIKYNSSLRCKAFENYQDIQIMHVDQKCAGIFMWVN
jgi:hypothetical protein